MEPSGRNQCQPVANGTAQKRALTSGLLQVKHPGQNLKEPAASYPQAAQVATPEV